MVFGSYLETGLGTDPVCLESGDLVIWEESEGQVVLGTPEGCGFGPGFCGISCHFSTQPGGECYAAFLLQVAPCTADLDSLPRTGSLCALANPRQVTDLLSFLDASEQQLPHPTPLLFQSYFNWLWQ